MKKLEKTKGNVVNIQMNNYIKPDPKVLLQQSTKYITNGTDNEYFTYVENRYLGSPTNQAVIDSYSNYIYGNGLSITSELISKNIISKTDTRLLVKDMKMQGAFALQVVYSRDKSKIAKLYHLPVKSIAIAKQDDITEEPDNYWYCFDWSNKTKFKPQMYPAFGKGTEEDFTEIFYVRIQSPQPLFSLPDYQSGLQYCDLEEELSNFLNKHIKNNFSAGKIINVNQGIPADDEAQEEAERAILGKVQGTSNAGNIIISFNDNKDNATTVDTIEIQDAYQQFQWLSEEARDKILMSHKVVNPILFGVKDGSGLGNNADEMIIALKTLYRSQINPTREVILDGLEYLLSFNDPNVKINFIDFEELLINKKEEEI